MQPHHGFISATRISSFRADVSADVPGPTYFGPTLDRLGGPDKDMSGFSRGRVAR